VQGDRSQADDLVQDCFHAAACSWSRLSSLSLAGQRAWLFTVVRNKSVDRFRADRRLELVGQDDVDEPDLAEDVEEVVLSRIALDRCWKLIKTMPPIQHRVAILRWEWDLSTGDIGQMLGIAQSTVRGHLKRARDALEQELRPEMPFADELAVDSREKAPS
jgi:RNA polymerase sigma-70 factor (ECF subfamily)